MTNVIGLYDDPGKAQQVINELMQAGLQQNDVELMAEDEQELESHISELGIREEDAHLYAEAVRHGKAVVRAQISDDRAEQILELLNRNGALDLDEVAQEFEQEEERLQKQTISQAEESLHVEKRKTLQGGKRVSTKVSEQPVEQKINLKEEKVEVRQEESSRKLSPEEAESAFRDETREFTETREVPEEIKPEEKKEK